MLERSVPSFVAQMAEIAELFGAEQPEIDRLTADLASLLDQFYIKMATYSLDIWEVEFGIDYDPELSTKQRRAQILGKLNTKAPATVKMLENLVRQVMGADRVWIVEHPHEYRFVVYVQEKKLSDLLGIAKTAVHDARPAHLNYHFIERMIRDSLTTEYVGAVGTTIKSTSAMADISRLYSKFYAGGCGTFIKIMKGVSR